jgi:hypothetical protein
MSIGEEIHEAVEQIHDLPSSFPRYVDCETLSRRHGLMRGSLIILDVVMPHVIYTDRKRLIEDHVPIFKESAAMRRRSGRPSSSSTPTSTAPASTPSSRASSSRSSIHRIPSSASIPSAKPRSGPNTASSKPMDRCAHADIKASLKQFGLTPGQNSEKSMHVFHHEHSTLGQCFPWLDTHLFDFF